MPAAATGFDGLLMFSLIRLAHGAGVAGKKKIRINLGCSRLYLKPCSFSAVVSPPLAMAALQNHIVAACMEDFLGLLPCLAWRAACRRPLTQATMQRIVEYLGRCGCALPAHLPLGAGVWTRLLAALALGPLLRLDNPAITGSWWNALVAPQLEVRVIVRHMRQDPPRIWSPPGRARRVAAGDLRGRLPAEILTLALPTLQQHGRNFYHRRTRTMHLHDNGHFVEAFRLEVNSLWFVLLGFEVIIRCTLARAVEPSESDGSQSWE